MEENVVNYYSGNIGYYVMMKQKSELIDIRDAFFDELYEIARKDKNVIFLTADMGAWSLNRFRKDLPDQFINMGIAEQNMVSVATGLTLGGKSVFIYSIVPFVTERCFEQIKIDLGVMNVPVTIVGAGPGLTYSSDGPTHHSLEDISLIRTLPGFEILNPCDQISAKASARIAYKSASPVYVRLDKGIRPLIYDERTDLSKGIYQIKEGQDLLIMATGVMTHNALILKEKLKAHSIEAGVVDMFRIKPLNKEEILKVAKKVNAIITLEEHTLTGGIGSAIAELLTDEGLLIPIKRVGINEECCDHYGDRDWYHSYYGLDIETVCDKIVEYHIKQSDKSNKAKLTVNDFAELFGTTSDNLSQECCRLVSKYDFRYTRLSKEETGQIVLKILKKILSMNLSVSGSERQNQWEAGWQENFQNFLDNDYDLIELIPKYYRPNNILRLNKEYVRSESDMFEYNFFRVLRCWVSHKYLENVNCIFEFACGSGHNLPVLANLYPEKKLYGLDWAQSSVDIINKMSGKYGWKMEGRFFDMFSPDYTLDVEQNSAFVTFGGLEQLGENFESFVRFALAKSPILCVNIEPLYELYDPENLVDYLGMLFHEKRGYLANFLKHIYSLEQLGKIEIVDVRRICFGGMYHDGWSIVAWRPMSHVATGITDDYKSSEMK